VSHTPGPWHSYKSTVYFPDKLGGFDIRACPDAEDNAQLIAAAPDLLMALKLLHDNTADYIRINNLGDPHQNQDMQMARAAIAKAEAQS
jgi:hypothetical protein